MEFGLFLCLSNVQHNSVCIFLFVCWDVGLLSSFLIHFLLLVPICWDTCESVIIRRCKIQKVLHSIFWYRLCSFCWFKICKTKTKNKMLLYEILDKKNLWIQNHLWFLQYSNMCKSELKTLEICNFCAFYTYYLKQHRKFFVS
jgi:hypothetical protein